MDMITRHSLLEPGRNCWTVEPADRAAFIVDVGPYLRVLRQALLKARHTVHILGWDIHSRIRLLRDDEADDGWPVTLGALLDAIARRNGVDVYVLCWDYAVIYTFERETEVLRELKEKTHERVHFHLDGKHPLGASQHQKLVVVDDQVAFCGGIDLGKWRWDTREHILDDPRRTDPDGHPYQPFHDIQMAVDGDCARKLAKLARARWHIATGKRLKPVWPKRGGDVWPPSLQPDLTDIDVAIARTIPQYNGQAGVHEVQALYLDTIAAARNFIYIENQYLTSNCIGDALIARLQEEDGPEIVIVQPVRTGGWLEQHTMDVLRGRLLERLRAADRHNRLRLYYPRLSEEPVVSLMVHAKIMVIDDCIVRIGSSNLSNRSMGFDGECDLLIEAQPNSSAYFAIRAFREGLLAEHLGKSIDEVRAAAKQHSLIGAIEQLAGGARTLQTLDVAINPEIDQWVPEDVLLDPEQPINSEIFVNHFVPREHQPHTFRRVAIAVAILVAMLALTAAWRWTALGDYLDLDNLIEQAKRISDNAATPFIAVGVISIAGALAIPLTLLVVVAVLAFGSLKGFVYSFIGAEISALLTYGIGHAMGNELVRRFAGRRLNQVSQQLSKHGLLTIITLRIVPVAPYAVINLIAGASHIRIKDFALGTLIGLLPGVTAIALFADSVADSIRNPRNTNFVVLAVILALLIGGMLWLRYWLRKKNADKQVDEAKEQSGNPAQDVARAGAYIQEHECSKDEARQNERESGRVQ